MTRFTFFIFFISTLVKAQPAFERDYTTVVSNVNNEELSQPWASGLNAVQVNTMDLDGDGNEDVVLFDRTANKVITHLSTSTGYTYAPLYENLFPPDLNNFLLLRDYNNDGLKDIFTGNPAGIKVYKNNSSNNNISWEHLLFETSNVILSTGFSGKINLQIQSDDIPSIMDMDNDGDLDILTMNFSGTGKIEYHKNVSADFENPDFVRITQSWGGITECGCELFAFNNESCSAGGRVLHAGGKFLLAIDVNADSNTDLIFSESECDKLYLLINEGTTENAVFTQAEIFPMPFENNGFYPTAYFEDATKDGIKDILLSPGVTAYNLAENIPDFSNSLLLYTNNGSNTNLQLDTEAKTFLQNEMIDVGTNAVPAFFDYDGDGDEDLFVGYFGKIQTSGLFNASLSLYENTGTQLSPVYQFITDDYSNITEKNLYNLKPQFIDINNDGRTDLVFTATSEALEETSLYYILNTSTTTLSLEPTLRITDINILFNENIHLTEINNDGLLDLLIGKANGSVEFWQNIGNSIAPNWQLNDNSFLNINASILRRNPSLFVADLDGDNRHDLLIGDQAGVIRVLTDFKSKNDFAQAEDRLIFNPTLSVFENANLGGSIWVSAVYTSVTNLVVGSMLGGLQWLKPLSDPLSLEIYPNPLLKEQQLRVETTSGGVMKVITATGQQLGVYTYVKGQNNFSLNTLSTGVYLLHFTNRNQTQVRRLVVY